MQGYKYCIKDLCDAQVESVDFRNAPEETRQRINAWVGRLTNGKISYAAHWISHTGYQEAERLVIVN